ncbi:MAG: hypothetical protein LJE59_10075 [Chromatiaceae bacterium]|jgi:hypothetical protein|nr:hypothetical protein [Chromatiaceae bacterium]
MAPLTSLFLAPVDPRSAPELASIQQVLLDLEVIARPLGPQTYAAGEGFSRQVVYAGCSPYLVMQPPSDGSLQFCHVALHGPFALPRLVTGPNTPKPRCPACRASLADWRTQLQDWLAGGAEVHCGTCQRKWSPHRLDWRGHAVSGRVLVELRNVFPGEATPSDKLINTLSERTGEAWRYAWAGCLVD